MGMPIKVYEEHFLPNRKTQIKAQIDPLSISTGLYIELELAKEHGLTLGEYRKLPRYERKLWLMFRVLSNAKDQHSLDEIKAKAEREAQFNQQANSPQGKFR